MSGLSVYKVTIGGTIGLTCVGQPLNDIDIVWIRYLIDSPSNLSVIYSDLRYVSTRLLPKFNVVNKLSDDDTVSSTLTITNVQSEDFLYGYECLCNIYRTCSSANRAYVNMTLTFIEPSKQSTCESLFLCSELNIL